MAKELPRISRRQGDVLDFILTRVDARRAPPTYREIGIALGIASTNGVHDHIKMLLKRGYLKPAKTLNGSPSHLARRLCVTRQARRWRKQRIQSIPMMEAIDGQLVQAGSLRLDLIGLGFNVLPPGRPSDQPNGPAEAVATTATPPQRPDPSKP